MVPEERIAEQEKEVKQAALVPTGTFTLVPTSLDEAIDFSKLIASSEMCPKDFRGKPQNVLIAVQMGMELRIPPMQALQNIAVINGRPCMWGDLVLGLVRASGLLEAIDERDPAECETKGEGRCEVRRVGIEAPLVRTFTLAMADKAKLRTRGGPDAPWATYPGRMLMFRARGWALRDMFGDVLKGLQTREEIEDYARHVPSVRMPVRRSTGEARAVEKFVSDGGAGSGGAPAKVASPAAPAQEPEIGSRWTGQILKVEDRRFASGLYYVIRGRDGMEFTTFDSAIASFARKAGASPVWIRWEAKPGKKDKTKIYQTIVAIGPETTTQPEPEREPGEDEEAEG